MPNQVEIYLRTITNPKLTKFMLNLTNVPRCERPSRTNKRSTLKCCYYF